MTASGCSGVTSMPFKPSSTTSGMPSTFDATIGRSKMHGIQQCRPQRLVQRRVQEHIKAGQVVTDILDPAGHLNIAKRADLVAKPVFVITVATQQELPVRPRPCNLARDLNNGRLAFVRMHQRTNVANQGLPRVLTAYRILQRTHQLQIPNARPESRWPHHRRSVPESRGRPHSRRQRSVPPAGTPSAATPCSSAERRRDA